MTVSVNNNKLETHPIARLVFGNLQGNNEENNRTLLGTARVCQAWRQNRDMIQARMAATMSLGLSRYQINMRLVNEYILDIVNDWGNIKEALKAIRQLK